MHEALTNAILHGNLELSSVLRETDETEYYRLSQDRRTQEPYRDRRVHLRNERATYAQIASELKAFAG